MRNEDCSSAEVFGCNTGNYVIIENPTEGIVNPREDVFGNLLSDINGLWQRARSQARTICKNPSQCCDAVTIRFECNLPWYLKTDDCGKEEIIKCKQ